MKTKITDYRGFEIYFDTEIEKFYVFSDSLDNESTIPDFSSAKKYIDDYIKTNQNFKYFYLERLDDNQYREKKIRILGIRKDNNFVYEDKKGNKRQLSKYDERDYFVIDDRNKPILEEIKKLRDDIHKISNEISRLDKMLHRVSAEDIKANYIQS